MGGGTWIPNSSFQTIFSDRVTRHGLAGIQPKVILLLVTHYGLQMHPTIGYSTESVPMSFFLTSKGVPVRLEFFN